MIRLAVLLYSLAAYAVFFGVFLYLVAFVANILVPRSIALGPEASPLAAALGNLTLIALFGLQHSVMARPAFKRWITRAIPPAMERSTFVLAASLLLVLLFWLWRPLPATLWRAEGGLATALLAASAVGWGIVLLSTFLINHFDLFGLRQSWRAFRGQPQTALRFVTPAFYRVVRHPLYVGWFFAFWCTPTMTVTHLFFAVMTTAYILIAIQLEERDLMREHVEYAAYRASVPMLIPFLRRRGRAVPPGIGAAPQH